MRPDWTSSASTADHSRARATSVPTAEHVFADQSIYNASRLRAVASISPSFLPHNGAGPLHAIPEHNLPPRDGSLPPSGHPPPHNLITDLRGSEIPNHSPVDDQWSVYSRDSLPPEDREHERLDHRKMSSPVSYMTPPVTMHDPQMQLTQPYGFPEYNQVGMPEMSFHQPPMDDTDPKFYGREFTSSPTISNNSSPKEVEMARRHQSHHMRRLSKVRYRTERSPNPTSVMSMPPHSGFEPSFQGAIAGPGASLAELPHNAAVRAPDPYFRHSSVDSVGSTASTSASPDPFGVPLDSGQHSPHYGMHGVNMIPSVENYYQPPPVRSVNELLERRSVNPTSAGPPNGGLPPREMPTSTPRDDQVRVINSRPKPRCWDHGCNGRQFSTFSNLLRHQREKSGTASKSFCPRCGAEFTRTTARNGHMAHDKCKPKKDS